MNTQEFLDRVLPDSGLRVVVSITPKGARQKFYPDNAAAAAALIAADSQGTDVYHGCATYTDNSSRKADNALAAKALWVDLDVGPSKPYASQADAGRAAVLFGKTVGLPPPLIVNSGRGLHVYWLLETEVCAADWQRAAAALKLAAKHAGLAADPSRTADVASILRTPGTTNHKDPDRPLAVVAVRDGKPAPYDFILGRLEQYLADNDVDVLGAAPSHVTVDNSDLEVKYDGPPPSVVPIVEGCAIIREFRDSQGQIEEPLWRACMGVVRHCENGAELCHEWSSGHPQYTAEETDAKLAGLEGTGPTTCEVLGHHRPDACATCPFFGKCRSPISIAYKAIPVATVEDPDNPEEEVGTPDLPDGFAWTSKGLYGRTKDKDGEVIDVRLSSLLFYPTGWTKDVEGKHALMVNVHTRPGQVDKFTLATGLVAEGGSKLNARLGEHMIMIERNRGPMVQHYLQEWADVLRLRSAPIATYNRFGWYGKDFLIGDDMYYANGTHQKVLLSGSAQEQLHSYTPKGDLQTWIETVERAYNHPTLEPLQFALLTGLASPLLNMFDEFGGVLVYMHTQETGEGKTTISRAALSCYNAWKDTQMSQGQFTLNALYATFGVANAMPLVLDEMTAIEPAQAVDMVHLISSGTPKRRCEKSGDLRRNDHRWSLLAIASGNNLFTEKIMQNRSQAAAEAARVFEYSIQDLNTPIPREEAARLFPKFGQNYGWAGREFIKYVVRNYDAVKEALLKTQAAVGPLFGIRRSERYWGALVACVLTTHKIAQKLGLVQFPRAGLVSFIQMALEQNRSGMALAKPEAADQIGRLIADLWGGVFVTHGKGDAYARWDAFVAKHASGKVTGRYIMRRPGQAGINDKPVIYLTMAAVNDWCASKNVSVRDLMREAAAKGLILPQPKQVYLGEGSVQYSGVASHRCLVIREDALPLTMAPGTPQLTVVQGGVATP